MMTQDEHLLAILTAPMLGKMSGLDTMEQGYVPEPREVRDAVHCANEALKLIKVAAKGGKF